MTIKTFATFNEDGYPAGFWRTDVYEIEDIPEDAVEITEDQWRTFLNHQGRSRLVNGQVVTTTAEPTEIIRESITYKADIWRRVTDEEAEIIDATLNTLPVRKQRLYNDAQFISHSDEMFTELMAGFVAAFGEERAEEILAPSTI
jgi:hypothetical protein